MTNLLLSCACYATLVVDWFEIDSCVKHCWLFFKLHSLSSTVGGNFIFSVRLHVAVNTITMRTLFSSCFAGIFFILTVSFSSANDQTGNAGNSAIYRQLLELLDKRDFFRLKAQLNLLGNKLDNKQQLYFQSYIHNAFNKNERAIKDVNTLLESSPSWLSDSSKAGLYQLLDDSYFKLFQYSKAAHSDSVILNRYSAVLDSEEVKDFQNKLLIRNGLKNIPPHQTIIQGTTIQWKKDKVGIIEIPIKRRNQFYDAIFDTRANISSISLTYSNKLGLQILPVFY